MGSLVSSQRSATHSTFSLRFYEVKGRRRRRRQNSRDVTDKDKRSSMNRPVLRLQVKQETLERQGIMTNGGSIHMVSKGTLRNIARESGICADHLFSDDSSTHSSPSRTRSLNSSPNHVHHNRHHSIESRDSMVIVQFVDNGDYDIGDNEKKENGYDKLLPPGEFEHLCTCTYGRVTPSSMVAHGGGASRLGKHRSASGDRDDEHFTTVRIERNGKAPTLMQALSMGELRDRIIQHLPPQQDGGYSSMERSQSLTGLSSYQLQRTNSRGLKPVPHHTILNSHLLEDDNNWSFGESIIKTLSMGNLFDIENPTHESERQIIKAWPELTDKMKKWKQSQQNLHQIGQGSNTVYTEC